MEPIQNPTQEPVQSPPEINVPQPKPNYLIIVIFSILGIILLASIIFLYFQNQQLKKQAVIQNVSPTIQQSSPTSQIIPPDETSSWKTYSNADFSFKYPPDWTIDGNLITSTSPKIKSVIVPSNSTLMNECMQEVSSQTVGNVFIKKFTRVTTGAMCTTSDSTPREIWIIPSATKYTPGVIFDYSSTESSQAESIFDQILSTFKFVDKNNLCELNDKTLCGFFVDKTLKTSDIDYILSLQQKTTVTCKKDQAYFNPKMCEGVSDGKKREGYSVGSIKSEGTIYSENEYKIFLNDYFKNNYSYHGIIIDSNKTAVVFVSNDKKTLLVFPLVKKNGIWTMNFILFGFDQDYHNLDRQVLDWFN